MGKLAIPKLHEKYETGQFFLHRVFGYRGVILFPWRAKIYDRNTYVSSYTDSNSESIQLNATKSEASTPTASEENSASNSGAKPNIQNTKKNDTNETDPARNDGKKEVTVDVQTYYQVLIDSRDCPHVVCVFFMHFNIYVEVVQFIH